MTLLGAEAAVSVVKTKRRYHIRPEWPLDASKNALSHLKSPPLTLRVSSVYEVAFGL